MVKNQSKIRKKSVYLLILALQVIIEGIIKLKWRSDD
jgi:hypothetical protein